MKGNISELIVGVLNYMKTLLPNVTVQVLFSPKTVLSEFLPVIQFDNINMAMTKFISLPTGQQMPILGFGTWQVRL